MRVVFTFDGRTEAHGSPLICHNERLSDPLDPHTRGIAEISGKRKKTEADHLELARREFLGGLYSNGNGPYLPAWNLLRCIQDGAKRIKRGKDVLRGIHPLIEETDILYDGPRDPDELWKKRDEGFMLRKGVGVTTNRVMRTRPLFKEWKAVLPCEVDPNVFDLDTLRQIAELAGKYDGLGDMRPIHGRSTISVDEAEDWLKLGNGDTDSTWEANRTRIAQILEEHEARVALH